MLLYTIKLYYYACYISVAYLRAEIVLLEHIALASTPICSSPSSFESKLYSYGIITIYSYGKQYIYINLHKMFNSERSLDNT